MLVDEPFAVFTLDESLNYLVHQGRLLPPLRLVYSLSALIHFIFPMKSQTCAPVDSGFDRIVSAVPLKSKGVLYMKDASEGESKKLLRSAVFVVTTDWQTLRLAHKEILPHIFISQGSGRLLTFLLGYIERIRDMELRRNVISCIRQCETALIAEHSCVCFSTDFPRRHCHFLSATRQC
jgi:hypothetical protein